MTVTRSALWFGCAVLFGCRDEGAPGIAIAPPAAPAPSAAGPSFEEKLAWAERLIARGEAGAARSAARELTEERRTDPRGWIALATAHQLTDDPKEAREAAKAAVALGPNEPAAWVALGAAQRALGDLSAAEVSLRRALELDPTSRAARFNLAGLAADRGDQVGAANALEELLVAHPEDGEVRYLLARALLDGGKPAAAEVELMRVVERHPAHVRAQRALAALAWDAQDYQRAFERAKIASRIDARDTATNNLLEASFYVIAASRMRCLSGPRPWKPEAMVAVLDKLEREEDLEGAATFVELDERFGANEAVQARVEQLAAACLAKP
jgi:tetratricopeptide (TPR) repeat protein